jgi:hypothetical protein
MWLSGLALFVLVFGLAFTPRQVTTMPQPRRPISVGIEILRDNHYLGDEGVGWLLFPLPWLQRPLLTSRASGARQESNAFS